MFTISLCSVSLFNRMNNDCARNSLGVFCRSNFVQLVVVVDEVDIICILREFRHKAFPPTYRLFVKSKSDFDTMRTYLKVERCLRFRSLSQGVLLDGE